MFTPGLSRQRAFIRRQHQFSRHPTNSILTALVGSARYRH